MSHSATDDDFLTVCSLFNKKTDHVITFTSNTYEIIRIFNVVFLSFLLFPTIFLNAVAIITIQRTPQLRKKVCYFIIFVQSLFDLGVGFIAIPMLIYFLLVPFLNVGICIPIILVRATIFLCTGLSSVTLSALTLERYLGVVHPFVHHIHVTKKRIVIYVVAGALILLSIIVASIFNQGRIIKHTAIGILGTFFVLIFYCYVRIYIVVRQNAARLKVGQSDDSDSGDRRHLFRKTKHARSCFIVVISFLCLLVPYTLSPIFVQFGKMIWNAYFWWSVSLLILISSINSITFFWRDSALRKEGIKIVRSILNLQNS